MENDFFKYLESKFPLSKLRNDIEKYIEYNEEEVNYMPSSHEFEEEERLIEYKRDDVVTLLAITAKRKYNGLSSIPVIVQVGIGKYFVNEQTGYYEVSKCTAEILYNENFEMFSIDFQYR